MKSTVRKFLALALVAGSVTMSAVAQSGPRAASHRETQEYMQAKVLPVLRQQRQKLEAELAPADRVQLATYRTKLKDLAQHGQAQRQAARALPRPTTPDSAAHHRGRPTPSPEQQAARDERRETMRQVALLAQKYQANITRLTTELQPQQAQWATDLRAIMAKNRPAGLRTAHAPHAGAAFDSVGHRRPFGPGFRGGELHQLLRASAFLLLDPGTSTQADEAAIATSLYPNPVAPTSQLQYEVKQPGPVTVELLDKTGTTLRPIVQAARQEKGPYTQPINLSDLPSGTYYYKVTTPTSSETKRFVKE